jgi:hypothetical protein
MSTRSVATFSIAAVAAASMLALSLGPASASVFPDLRWNNPSLPLRSIGSGGEVAVGRDAAVGAVVGAGVADGAGGPRAIGVPATVGAVIMAACTAPD